MHHIKNVLVYMSNNGVNALVKSDFTFYKKVGPFHSNHIKYGVRSTESSSWHLNTDGRYRYLVTYVHECNLENYFTPFVRCFVQGYNLRGDRNKLCIFLLASGLIYLPKLIFFLSNWKFFIVNSAIKSQPNIIFSSLNKNKTF